jgi:hypothetical protein
MMTLDQILQIAILLVGIVALLVPMHLQNRAKAKELLDELRAHARRSKRLGRRLKRHEKFCEVYRQETDERLRLLVKGARFRRSPVKLMPVCFAMAPSSHPPT